PKVLRKAIKACLKKYEGLAEEECVKRFCYVLKDAWNWEQETFTCNLGVMNKSHVVLFSTQYLERKTDLSPEIE
ncbi:unnamed protein product, partial [Rotaria magnacalcarata]